MAEMVRAATATELSRLAQRALFEPLGLTSARLGGAASVVLPGCPDPPHTIGDGGLWISARDLATWLAALNDDAFGAEAGRLLRSTGQLSNGDRVAYAWGTTARPHPVGTVFTHGGDWPGWAAKTLRQPATGITVALMSAGADPLLLSDMATDIAMSLGEQGR